MGEESFEYYLFYLSKTIQNLQNKPLFFHMKSMLTAHNTRRERQISCKLTCITYGKIMFFDNCKQ